MSSKLKLDELVPQLEFYGTGDEAYELFQQACGFCYSLVGLGEREKAEIVYQWAKEMADASKQFYFENRSEEFKKTVGCGHTFNRKRMKFCPECGKKAWLEPNVDMRYGTWDYY